jgi:N-methylhydantoinase A
VLVNLNTAVIGHRRAMPLETLAGAGGAEAQPVETRKVWFPEGWQETPIYRRRDLGPGSLVKGPAIVEQLDTTVVVEPGDLVAVDGIGNLINDVG